MNNDKLIKPRIAGIKQMKLAELQAKFMELYGFETGSKSVTGLRGRLIYRIQEIHRGDLSREDEKFLLRIAEKDHLATLGKAGKKQKAIIPGTKLSREWQGKNYEVTVRPDGKFECEGNIYSSLSAVARAITGSRWNGKVFFGVK
ncbi:MAG: DUF2924 domain-containing protein [Victivallaceae bacterium]|nr:DUF2924 domain-containing protein [Victivallaceae bacterium]